MDDIQHKHTIPFIQYKRDGTVEAVQVPADSAICERANVLILDGWQFTCEVMSNLFCMFSARVLHENGVYYSKIDKISSNDPHDIESCVEEMVNEAWECIDA